MIDTARLTLAPASAGLARAEIYDRGEFARQLGARVPDTWPPETLADALPLILGLLEAAPDQVGWFRRYALAADGASGEPVLVGSGGFRGPPQDGTVEIGDSVLPQFQGRGYATEVVGGLLRWAIEEHGVARVGATAQWSNPASVRVLIKAGFVPVGTTPGPGGQQFELRGGG